MPLDLVDLGKLILGIIIIIIPGYLWSYLFSKQITRLERVVFGFILGLFLLSAIPYILNIAFIIPLSRDVIYVIFLMYTIPAVLIFWYVFYKSKKHEYKILSFFNWRNLLIFCLLGFAVFMIFLPHFSMNYLLPLHVDEWVHWSYSRAVIDTGSVHFSNPYTWNLTFANHEIGFHTYTASLYWFSSSSLLTLFLYMPSILAVFLCLTAFCIGERSEKKFGFEACLFVSLIPTTTRYLGPSFYVAVTVGLLLLLFLVWIIQQERFAFSLLIAPLIWCLFLIHPLTAFAGFILASIYCIMLVIEKKYRIATISGTNTALACIPFVILVFSPSRWKDAIDVFLNAAAGEQYGLELPAIFVDFSNLGLITWVMFILGIYYVITRGKSLHIALLFSSIAFIVIIGLYSLFGYGIDLVYDRTFLYLFLFVPLVAAFGLCELRSMIATRVMSYVPQRIFRYDKQVKHLVFPAVVVIILLFTVVPSHLSIPYYKMINEEDYESFVWIRENLGRYHDINHTYARAAVHPYKASPFSAITGLHIATSSMHPVIRDWFWSDMLSFLDNQCKDTEFLIRNRITVVYGSCNNSNLMMIYPKVYLYRDLFFEK